MKIPSLRRPTAPQTALGVALALAVAGAWTLSGGHAVTTKGIELAGAPQPPATAARAIPASIPHAVNPLPHSKPTHISIPRVGINADIIEIGVTPDGMLDAPSPQDAHRAGWLKTSPSPGEQGAAILDGHVDSRNVARGTAAFYRLGETRPGDTIDVRRTDGIVAEFTVDSVKLVPRSKSSSPVFDTPSYAAIRVITCGGRFDTAKGEYLDNVVVWGHLTGSHNERR